MNAMKSTLLLRVFPAHAGVIPVTQAQS